MRPLFAFIAAALLACSAPTRRLTTCATAGNDNAFLNIQTIRLWPGDAPRPRAQPATTSPRSPSSGRAQATANGSAVIVLPGGAYRGLAGDLEGREVADWFTVRGFRAFILSYRLTSHGYLLPVPLLDARRAVQLVRARAQRLPDRSQPHRHHRLLRRRPPRRARRNPVRPRQTRRRRPHRPRLQPPRLPRPRLRLARRHLQRTPRT